MIRGERVVHGPVRSEHIVQFFDTTESLGDSIGAYLAEGLSQGEHLLVVARKLNWQAISGQLATLGWDVPAAIANCRLTLLDANLTLREVMRSGLPDSILFHKTVGELAQHHCKTPGGLRVYGEMAEILAEEANFHAAQRLEELWNELAARCAFVLLCGYSAVHFATHDRVALSAICATHTHVHAKPDDPLAHWLIARERLTNREDVLPS